MPARKLKKYAVLVGSTPYVVDAYNKVDAHKKLKKGMSKEVKLKLKDVYLY